MLTYRQESGGEATTREFSPAGSYDETISGLEKGTRYEITITPYNSAGAGDVYMGGIETQVDRKLIWGGKSTGRKVGGEGEEICLKISNAGWIGHMATVNYDWVRVQSTKFRSTECMHKVLFTELHFEHEDSA